MIWDVAAVGDLFADVIVSGDRRPEFGQAEVMARSYAIDVGGSGPIFAAQFARLGGRAGLVGQVGDDLLGREICQRLEELGVDITAVRRVEGGTTALGLNLQVGDDRAMVTVPGVLETLPQTVLSGYYLAGVRHWHIAGYFLLPTLRHAWSPAIEVLKRHGATVSLDPNWSPEHDWNSVRPLLAQIDVFLPNEREACAIAGAGDWREAGQSLAREVRIVVIKRGEQGAALFADGACREFPAAPRRGREAFVDAVGAGDNFAAGFVWAWLRQKPLDECVRLGVRCGSYSTGAAGGISGQLQGHECEVLA